MKPPERMAVRRPAAWAAASNPGRPGKFEAFGKDPGQDAGVEAGQKRQAAAQAGPVVEFAPHGGFR